MIALHEVEAVVIGRTRFQPMLQASDGDVLTMRVLERGAWVNGDAPVPELDEVRQTRAAYSPWRWPGSWPAPELVLSLGLLGIALLTSFLKWYRPGVASGEGFLLSVAAAGLAMTSAAAVAGSRLGEGWHLAILLGVTGAWLFGLPRTKLAAAVLVMAGILTAWGLWFQLDLGLRASDTGGLRFWLRGVSGATIFLAVLLGHRASMAYRRTETGPASLALPLAVVALLSLLVQAAAGGEAGVYGIQPVEIAKLALVLLAAHVAAQVGSYAPGVVGLRVAGSAVLLVLLYLAIVATALLLVRDFSPLALIALWCAGMVLALVTAVRSAALSLALLFMGALALPLLWLGQADVIEQLQAQGVYGDRLEVWLLPELYPHSGDQFLRAQDLMAGAELRGQEVNGWRVPAAQDDFMASVVAARYGLVGLGGLLASQISFVMLLLLVAHQHLAHARMARDGRRRVDHAFRFYALYGGAFILLAHAVLSFGTNLGYLPVMGQPLWGISHANSLRLLFVLPLLLLLQAGETPGMNKGGNRQRHGG
jgi:cell division protein FtsW